MCVLFWWKGGDGTWVAGVVVMGFWFGAWGVYNITCFDVFLVCVLLVGCVIV